MCLYVNKCHASIVYKSTFLTLFPSPVSAWHLFINFSCFLLCYDLYFFINKFFFRLDNLCEEMKVNNRSLETNRFESQQVCKCAPEFRWLEKQNEFGMKRTFNTKFAYIFDFLKKKHSSKSHTLTFEVEYLHIFARFNEKSFKFSNVSVDTNALIIFIVIFLNIKRFIQNCGKQRVIAELAEP